MNRLRCYKLADRRRLCHTSQWPLGGARGTAPVHARQPLLTQDWSKAVVATWRRWLPAMWTCIPPDKPSRCFGVDGGPDRRGCVEQLTHTADLVIDPRSASAAGGSGDTAKEGFSQTVEQAKPSGQIGNEFSERARGMPGAHAMRHAGGLGCGSARAEGRRPAGLRCRLA